MTQLADQILQLRRTNRFCIDCGSGTNLEFRRGAMIGESRWICRDPEACERRVARQALRQARSR